jgi:hypothetical protein
MAAPATAGGWVREVTSCQDDPDHTQVSLRANPPPVSPPNTTNWPVAASYALAALSRALGWLLALTRSHLALVGVAVVFAPAEVVSTNVNVSAMTTASLDYSRDSGMRLPVSA